MQRFYFPDLEQIDDNIIIKNSDLLNQLNKVLRAKSGDKFVFFNGVDEIDFIFQIITIEKREAYLEKVGEIKVNNEIDFDLNIIGALPNSLSKIEYIVQKGVEIGVTGFYFFKAERSQKLILSENKIERLKKIIIEATEQSGRSKVAELIIEDNINLEDFNGNENIIFHTKDDHSINLKDLKVHYDFGINLFVGPEGGFCNEEIDIFEKIGFKKVHLGNRILRTETTGIVAGFYLIQSK